MREKAVRSKEKLAFTHRLSFSTDVAFLEEGRKEDHE
jgi:hypothetical protein